MFEVYIDTQDPAEYLWGKDELWKEYCGVENFDETFVLFGNRQYNKHVEASWYINAKEIMDDLDAYGTEQFDPYDYEMTDEQYKAISKMYIDNHDKVNTDEEMLILILKILYPDDTFKTETIRGYNQSDWQNVMYKANEVKDLDLLESIYFGKINEFYYQDEDGCSVSTIVTDNELWKAEREGRLKDFVRKNLNIPKDEDFKVYQSDGFIRQTKWKEIA